MDNKRKFNGPTFLTIWNGMTRSTRTILYEAGIEDINEVSVETVGATENGALRE